MGKKASDIIRELFGKIMIGEKVIALTVEAHNSILIALMNLATSTAGNSDAKKSSETILDFISELKVSELEDYTIEVGDGVKTAVFNGKALRDLAMVWGDVKVTWHVTRGGKRATASVDNVKLSDLI